MAARPAGIIRVLEGRGLAAKDLSGLSNPYVLIGAAHPTTGLFVDPQTCITSEVYIIPLSPQSNPLIV